MSTHHTLGRAALLAATGLAIMATAACGASSKGSFLATRLDASGPMPILVEEGGGGGAEAGAGAGRAGSGGLDGSTGTGQGLNGDDVNTPTRPGTPREAPPPTTGLVSNTTGLLTDLAGGLLHTTGNAVLVAPSLLTPVTSVPVAGSVVGAVVAGGGSLLSNTGQALASDGLGGLPVVGGTVQQVASGADQTLNGATTVSLGDRTLIGSTASGATSAIGVSVLSPEQNSGALASVGVLSGGQTLTAALGSPTTGAPAPTSNLASDGLLGVQLGATPVVGAGTSPLIGVSAGAAAPVEGGLLTVALVGHGQPLAVGVDLAGGLGGLLGGSPVTSPPSSPAPTPAPAPPPPLTGVVGAVAAPVVAPLTPVLQTTTGVVGGLLGGLGLH